MACLLIFLVLFSLQLEAKDTLLTIMLHDRLRGLLTLASAIHDTPLYTRDVGFRNVVCGRRWRRGYGGMRSTGRTSGVLSGFPKVVSVANNNNP